MWHSPYLYAELQRDSLPAPNDDVYMPTLLLLTCMGQSPRKLLHTNMMRAGASAPPISMPWHLSYSAPEVVSDPNLPAHQQNPVTVDPSADMYSVGVIAYELLTQQRVFPDGCSDSDIREALTAGADGVGGLPWEQGVSGSLERNRKIPKPLRHAVLACLDRDVENRLSAASLLSLWESAPWERIIDELRAEVTN